MASSYDPKESLMSSIQSVKDVFLPIEVGIRKAAQDLEQCWVGSRNKKDGVGLISQFSGGVKIGKFQVVTVKKKNGQCVVSDERRKGLSVKVPIKAFLGMFSHNSGKECKDEVSTGGIEDGSCTNCLKFSVIWSRMVNSFVQALPAPFKTVRKRSQKIDAEERLFSSEKLSTSCGLKRNGAGLDLVSAYGKNTQIQREVKHISLECLIGFIFDQLNQNFQKFDWGVQNNKHMCNDTCDPPPLPSHFDHLKAFLNILEGRKADVNGFFGNLMFARVGGVPSSAVDVTRSGNEEGDDGGVATGSREEAGESGPQKVATRGREETGGSVQKVATGILSNPLSNVERLRTTLSTFSVTELIMLVSQLMRTSKDHPDKKKLFSVQDFYRYTEAEGMES